MKKKEEAKSESSRFSSMKPIAKDVFSGIKEEITPFIKTIIVSAGLSILVICCAWLGTFSPIGRDTFLLFYFFMNFMIMVIFIDANKRRKARIKELEEEAKHL
jgi:hypothetical protein